MSTCAAGARCTSWDHTARQPAPAALNAALCADDLRLAARDTAALVRDYADLEAQIPAGGGGPTGRAAPGPRWPVPIDLGVDALQRAIAHTLTLWEPAVREAAGLPPEQTSGVRPGWAVATAAAVIAPRVPLMSTLGPLCAFHDGWDAGPAERTGVEGLGALRALHRRARAVLGVTSIVHRLPGTCSGCGLDALRRVDGRETVYCDGCGRRWTWDDYQRYVGLMLDALGA